MTEENRYSDSLLGIGNNDKNTFKSCCSNFLIPEDNINMTSWDGIPDWYKYNKHIYYGYRVPYLNIKQLTLSCFKIHNETLNIWTHLLAAILFFCFFIYSLIGGSDYNVYDNLSVNIFLVSAIICFSFSTIMHTYFPISKTVCRILANFDYFGICLLITGSYVPFIYYTFYCYIEIRTFYLLGLGLCTLLSFPIILNHHCPQKFRSLIYIFLGLYGVCPIIHKFVIMGDNQENTFITELFLIGLVAFFYITGVLFYTSHIPEIIHRDLFNYYFSSHQLFHFFTIAGAVTHFLAIEYAYKKHINYICQ